MGAEDLSVRFIEQNCRLFMDLLSAAKDGFKEASDLDRDRLLRVLAYVRKDDDHIPDYRRDGYFDDRQEVRAAMTELSPLLHRFKAWRLRHRVPMLWLQSSASEPRPAL
jgi:hypothetical protein